MSLGIVPIGTKYYNQAVFIFPLQNDFVSPNKYKSPYNHRNNIIILCSRRTICFNRKVYFNRTDLTRGRLIFKT